MYVSIVGVNIVKLYGLAAKLPEDGVIEMAFKRNALEDGLAYHYAEDGGSH